jgi:hypothetical protein
LATQTQQRGRWMLSGQGRRLGWLLQANATGLQRSARSYCEKSHSAHPLALAAHESQPSGATHSLGSFLRDWQRSRQTRCEPARGNCGSGNAEIGQGARPLISFAERGFQQLDRITLTKSYRSKNSYGDDLTRHLIRMAGRAKLVAGGVQSFRHLRNCFGSEHLR